MPEVTYRVHGVAHGVTFDEYDFPEEAGAVAYASTIIDGDVDSTIEITKMLECPYCEQRINLSDAADMTAHGLGNDWYFGDYNRGAVAR